MDFLPISFSACKSSRRIIEIIQTKFLFAAIFKIKILKFRLSVPTKLDLSRFFRTINQLINPYILNSLLHREHNEVTKLLEEAVISIF